MKRKPMGFLQKSLNELLDMYNHYLLGKYMLKVVNLKQEPLMMLLYGVQFQSVQLPTFFRFFQNLLEFRHLQLKYYVHWLILIAL